MNKIVAGIETIDPNTGLHLPNTCDPNYYKEGSLTPYPLTLGPYMFKSTMDAGKDAYQHHTNTLYRCVQYEPVPDITGNYLYIVTVYSTSYFTDNEKIGFKFVDPKVLADARDGCCQIVFINTTEGMSGIKGIIQEFDFSIIENWCKEYTIPTRSVHYIHGNLLSKDRATDQGCTYNVYPLTVQECWNNINAYPSGVTKFDPDESVVLPQAPYLYLSYNRQPRFHRILMLSMLMKEGLFNLGLKSFNALDRNAQWFESIFRSFGQIEYYDNVKKLFDQSPIIADCDNTNISSSVGDIQNYNQTFISVVTETLTDEGTLFCSEKTWRSIIVGHPFMILAGKGMLAYLKSQGFKTFSKWINEDYDDMDDQIDRIKCIVGELKRLSKLPLSELKAIREEMEPVLIHNKAVMQKRIKDKFFENNEYVMFKPIEDLLIEISKRNKKKVVVCGAGGFIGSHLVTDLKAKGYYVIGADLKYPEYNKTDADEFHIMDLRDPVNVATLLTDDVYEIYQLAADMGGAGYIFTGDHDADIVHNSAMINLNVVHEMTIKGIKRVFYSSSACMYPSRNQTDPNNPLLSEESAYPADPDSEYGWEKLFSERLYMSFARNYGIRARIARFHNIFGPLGSWNNGKEKAPAALCRKVAESKGSIDVWGPGIQTRSFLYIDECVEGIHKIMASDCEFPLNLGSERMISINALALLIARIADKEITINNIPGPMGVMGRNSHNKLIKETIGWAPGEDLEAGIEQTYKWISQQVKEHEQS